MFGGENAEWHIESALSEEVAFMGMHIKAWDRLLILLFLNLEYLHHLLFVEGILLFNSSLTLLT